MTRNKEKKCFYAVREGRQRGIYRTWDEARKQVEHYAGSVHKGFRTLEEAEAYLQLGSLPPIPLKTTKLPKIITKPLVPENSLAIYVDGSCIHQGDPKKARAGAGVYFGEDDPRNESVVIPRHLYKQTNNVGELLGVITALEKCSSHVGHVTVLTDSMYVVDAANKWRFGWKAKNWNVNIENQWLMKRLSDLIDARGQSNCLIKHVPGHCGIPGNEKADILAKLACLMQKL
jgi:ribonuclease HI